MSTLEIKDLHVSIDTEQGVKEILKGVSLTIRTGETHAIMGPNGSGKSTLAHVLMGHPAYEVTGGSVTLDGVDVLDLEADERSRLGLFLAFQYPHAVPGVTVSSFLRQAINAHRKGGPDGAEDPISVKEFAERLRQSMALLHIDQAIRNRYLNDGFSGGEKKRVEILQMAMLRPRMAILDETDSGLDIDALRIVATGVDSLRGPDLGVLLITHYQRILDYITPDAVHILVDGRIIRSGGPELATELEAGGYAAVRGEESAV
jgi:Fe-S cluster assembly ATP-binding protein